MKSSSNLVWGSTEQFAELVEVKPETIRHGLCVKGHYLGLKPIKLPNRLLRWNLTEARKILGLESGEGF